MESCATLVIFLLQVDVWVLGQPADLGGVAGTAGVEEGKRDPALMSLVSFWFWKEQLKVPSSLESKVKA